MSIEPDRILAEACNLSFPRYPGTAGDPRARTYVSGRLEEAGLEICQEEFSYDVRPAERALRAILVISGLLIGGAGPASWYSPLLGLGLLVLALLVVGGLLAWTPGIERIYRREGRTRTANVVGRRPAPAPRLTLMVMAHHDSKSQNLSLPVRAGLSAVALPGALLLGLLLFVGLFRTGGPPGPPWLAPACGGGVALALFVLATLRSGNRSPGAVDNAGSVAVLLELARVLPGRVPDDVELIFLATGAEEDHMVGAMRWLDAHREDLRGRPVYALNFDGAGAPGKVVLLERFGLGRSFSRTLSHAVRRSASILEIPLRGVIMPPALGVDAIPFANRGIECLTFATGDLGRAVLAVHSARDVPENLDRDALGRVARLALALLQDLARDPESDQG